MEQRDKDRLLANLKSLPNELDDLLAGLDDQTLRWRPIPNKWSIKEIMCHLRDMERLAYLARYRRMLAEENPLLPNVDQNRIAFAHTAPVQRRVVNLALGKPLFVIKKMASRLNGTMQFILVRHLDLRMYSKKVGQRGSASFLHAGNNEIQFCSR